MRRGGAIVCAAVAVLAPKGADAAPLERQPYLQLSAPEEVTIVWTTTEDSTGAVEYGASIDALSERVDAKLIETMHQVRLTGLQPDTKYFYRVRSDDEVVAGGDAEHWFRTPPVAGTTKKFRAWVAGDTGSGSDAQLDVFAAMLSATTGQRPDLVLTLGDVAYGSGAYDEFTDKFFGVYQSILRNTPSWPTLGNADGGMADSDTEVGPYYDAFVLPSGAEAGGVESGTEAYYSFDYANVHFIVLDSYDTNRDPDGPMLQWALADLAATEQDWAIAYWHHPPFSKGTHNSDTESALIDIRRDVLPILEAGGIDMVFAGHSHIYERSYLLDSAYQTPSVAGQGVLNEGDAQVLGDGPLSKPSGLVPHRGTVYVVAGHGGASVFKGEVHPLMAFAEGKHGSCLLDIQDNRLTLTNVRDDGEITDRMDLVKGDALVVARPNGNEHLLPGTAYNIAWRTVGADVSTVRIEYSDDGGQSWATIADSAPNTGAFKWMLPKAETTAGLIRVRDAASGVGVSDESNAVFSVVTPERTQAINFGDAWRYNDQGQNLGTEWVATDYDDSDWQHGPAQLGYGDGDEATVLDNADPNAPTVYLRKPFTLEAAPVVAELSLFYDDGIVVFINGFQVLSDDAADSSPQSYAASPWSHDSEVRTFAINPLRLDEGENVIAVMVKANSARSTDLSFDLALRVTELAGPPTPGDDGDTGSDADSGTDDNTGAGSGVGLGEANSANLTSAISSQESSCACTADRSGERGLGWLAWGLMSGVWLRRRRA